MDADRFSTSLERKWARERRQRTNPSAAAPTAPTPIDEIAEDAERWDNTSPLEPTIAHKSGERCTLCYMYIVTADGIVYAHRLCAVDAGWPADV